MLNKFPKATLVLVLLLSFSFTGCVQLSEMVPQIEKALRMKIDNQTTDSDYCATMQMRWLKSDYKRLPGWEKFKLGSVLRQKYSSIIIKKTQRTEKKQIKKDYLELISSECGELNSLDCMADDIVEDTRRLSKTVDIEGVSPKSKAIKGTDLILATEKTDIFKTKRVFRTQNQELFDSLSAGDLETLSDAINAGEVVLHNQNVETKSN